MPYKKERSRKKRRERSVKKENTSDKDTKRKKLCHYEGQITLTQNKTGFVALPEFEEDIVIESQNLNTALNKDTVEICLLPQREGERRTGEVLEIKERYKTTFVGTIQRNQKDSFAFLISDDKKMYRDFFVPSVSKNVKDNYKAIVELVEWKTSKNNPTGKIIKVIGKKGEIDTEMHSIVYENNLAIDFPSKVTDEANKIKKQADVIFKKEESVRKDFRGITTLTIDPYDAKDFDDAISFEKLNEEEFEIGIHIADVTAYVTPGSAMDREAKKRGYTIYLVDRTVPMLPEVLSNDLCSLNPNTDKLAYSAVFKMDIGGNVKDAWFGRTMIHSDKRFTYEEAQTILDTKQGEYHEELAVLDEIAKNIRDKRFVQGAIDFEQSEIQFKLDKKGHPVEINLKERLNTHKLIEEFMILANNQVAKFLGGNGEEDEVEVPTLYRVHESPKSEAVNAFVQLAEGLGYSVEAEDGMIEIKELNNLLHQLSGKPEEGLMNNLILRAMSKAKYSLKNTGHFGLSLSHYLHFTSPIRRYADMTVHQVLEKKLKGKKITDDEKVMYASLADHLSEIELQVNQAEYTSIELKQTEYMLDHKGEVYDAVITGIKKFGMFVQINATLAEGLIHISQIDDDFYELDELGYSLIGKKNNKKYTIGDRVRVKVVKADIEKRDIDLVLVD
jgi:ribonuclease R